MEELLIDLSMQVPYAASLPKMGKTFGKIYLWVSTLSAGLFLGGVDFRWEVGPCSEFKLSNISN